MKKKNLTDLKFNLNPAPCRLVSKSFHKMSNVPNDMQYFCMYKTYSYDRHALYSPGKFGWPYIIYMHPIRTIIYYVGMSNDRLLLYNSVVL